MAKKNGYFRPNPYGYLQIMNGDAGVWAECERVAGNIMVSAMAQSGAQTDYAIDTMRGLHRLHTRVSTTTVKDYFRESHYHALAIACATAGGKASSGRGYKTLQSAVKREHKKWAKKAWKDSYDRRR